MWGIRLVGVRDSGYDMRIRSPWEGNWLTAYSPDACAGLGEATFDSDQAKALRFASPAEAEAFWKQQSEVLPMREVAGRTFENRPLAIATSIAIEEIG